MSDRCPNCGPRGFRIEAPITVNESTIPDAYCGVCGFNWGVKQKPSKHQTKTPQHDRSRDVIQVLR